MTTKVSHSVGEQPTNPIITDKWVYCIANVEQEYPPEDDGMDHWKYDVIEQIPIVEYTKRRESEIAEATELSEARSLTNAFELYMDLTGGV